jgi:UDP-N-acetylmuramoyl-tripeptide--D-alanyl-D-alanine ligase
MKNSLKSIIAVALMLLARAVVRRYRPRIVLVSGSVGKTATKDAVATALAARFLVRKSEKSFNTEFGIPFTILGVENPLNNRIAWLSIAKRALTLLLLPNHYPNMLVLEAGADRPGDIAKILRIITPNAVVITRLPEIPVHVEAYVSPEAVREEEFSPAYMLSAAAPLIVPADDPYALDSALRTPARCISYGTSDGADVRVSDTDFYEQEQRVVGMQANIHIAGKQKNLAVKGSIGAIQLLPAAAALATALAFDIPPQEAFNAIENYEPPPGRGRILYGTNGSIIIDDSYNASPAAVEEALVTLKTFPMPTGQAGGRQSTGRRIAVLGDMLELGRYSVMEHKRIGALANDSADVIAAVGIRARAFAAAAKNAELMLFDTAVTAARALPDFVRAGDVILVKGSQNVRTERIVEALLADPADSARLVRQDRAWKRRL